VASPVVGATIPASGYTFYERDEVNAGWPTPTGTFTQGKGYIALPTLAGSTLTFSGQLNLSNLDVSLTWSGASSKGFNLIGNPYPSHLTWTKTFVDDATNVSLIEPSIYLRTNTGGAEATNGNHLWSTPTYNASTGAAVNAGTNIIPPMQAFWVRAKAAGNLTLDNSKLACSHESSNPFKARAVDTSKNLRLVLSDSQSKDEILLYFNENASNDFDRYDSPKMMNGSTSSIPDIYTMAGAEQLVINGMSTIPAEIPLYFKSNASTATQFSLSATEMSNFEAGNQVYIKNNKTGEQQLISDGSVYNFDKAADPTFSIIFKSTDVHAGAKNPELQNTIISKNANNQITVTCTGNLTNNNYVTVFNALGQKLIEKQLNNNFTVLPVPAASGVYVVTVRIAGEKITRKVTLN
jgi:hypothetical protein